MILWQPQTNFNQNEKETNRDLFYNKYNDSFLYFLKLYNHNRQLFFLFFLLWILTYNIQVESATVGHMKWAQNPSMFINHD